ncbi:hypothetical protein [Solicola gregarius]|uniref:DUF3800 domain-containing protein n=1 Tax=Solicola gregarius TaxID=2908642 RepID=A0AA46TFF4_9ACTN|nr:hypothetical protein [Solicola gregarius]UYM04336.1 hypothetical protein L0C25_17600 [Solicola gregarius]
MNATYEPSVTEIACDESGWAGENLLDGNTDVFAHASVRMAPERAAGLVDEVRRRIQSPATEYKAGHLLRAKHRDVLEWFLSREGPLTGWASVYLVDKVYLVVRTLVELLARRGYGTIDDPHDVARTLYRDGEGVLGSRQWARLLADAQALIRVPGRDIHPVEPVLDPLPDAIVRAGLRWSHDGSVSIVHDRQSTLTHARLAHVMHDPDVAGRIASIRLVAAHSDARVQVADFLAGTARSIASDELNGRGDDVLSTLLRPYVDRASIWADGRSWSRITT